MSLLYTWKSLDAIPEFSTGTPTPTPFLTVSITTVLSIDVALSTSRVYVLNLSSIVKIILAKPCIDCGIVRSIVVIPSCVLMCSGASSILFVPPALCYTHVVSRRILT